MTFEVTLLDDAAPVAISSQILNRQDGQDEYRTQVRGRGRVDPRKAERFAGGCWSRWSTAASDTGRSLGYRCADSGMTLAVGADHHIETENVYEQLHRGRARTSPRRVTGSRPSPADDHASPRP